MNVCMGCICILYGVCVVCIWVCVQCGVCIYGMCVWYVYGVFVHVVWICEIYMCMYVYEMYIMWYGMRVVWNVCVMCGICAVCIHTHMYVLRD